jgi:hypothetical protein
MIFLLRFCCHILSCARADPRCPSRTGGTECEANDGKVIVDITNRQQKDKASGKAAVPCVRATYFWQDKNSVRHPLDKYHSAFDAHF